MRSGQRSVASVVGVRGRGGRSATLEGVGGRVAGAWWWLLPCVLAVATTAWRYDAKPLWRDEFYTLGTASRGLAVMLRGLRVTDGGMGPWYVLMHPWVQVSHAAAWVRLPGAVCAVVNVALVAACARRLHGLAGGPGGTRLAGAAAGLSTALLPVLLDHSQEARPYPLVAVCVTATAWALLRDRERPRARWLALWVAASTLAAALHVLSGAPACAALVAVAFLTAARGRRRRLLLGAVLPAAVTAGMVAVGFSQAPNRIGGDFPVLARTLELRHSVAGGEVASVVLGVLCVLGAVSWAGSRRRGGGRFAVLFVGAWILAPVAADVGSALGGQLFEPRYAVAAASGVAVLSGAGVAAIAGRGGSARPSVAVGRPVAAGLALVLLMGAQVPYLVHARRLPYVVDDMPSAARAVLARARPGDAVVYLGNTTRPMARYYLPPGAGLDDVFLRDDPAVAVSIGGDEIDPAERGPVLAPRPRVWVIGVRLNDPWDVVFPASWAAARADRTLRFEQDYGRMRVQLWVRPGTT